MGLCARGKKDPCGSAESEELLTIRGLRLGVCPPFNTSGGRKEDDMIGLARRPSPRGDATLGVESTLQDFR